MTLMNGTILLDCERRWLRRPLPMHRGATLKIRVLLRIVPPIQYVILNMAFKSARIPLARSPLARNRRFLIIDHRVLVNY